MAIQHHRPPEADGKRLFYRTQHTFSRQKFNPFDPDNITVMLRMYRWSLAEYEREQKIGEFGGMILKDDLMRYVFPDCPNVKKQRVGKVLRLCIQYEPGFQRNPAKSNGWKNEFFWRWNHALDLVYGLEFLMLSWLPRVVEADGGECRTAEDFAEELEVIRDQTKEEDDALIDAVLRSRLQVQ